LEELLEKLDRKKRAINHKPRIPDIAGRSAVIAIYHFTASELKNT
jgi:hypothetical protein